MNNLIFRMPNGIFFSNTSFWLQNLFKIYEANLPGLTRELNTCLAPNLIQHLTELRPNEIYLATNSLCICATLFPSVISAKRHLIESKIIETISSVVSSSNDSGLL